MHKNVCTKLRWITFLSINWMDAVLSNIKQTKPTELCSYQSMFALKWSDSQKWIWSPMPDGVFVYFVLTSVVSAAPSGRAFPPCAVVVGHGPVFNWIAGDGVRCQSADLYTRVMAKEFWEGHPEQTKKIYYMYIIYNAWRIGRNIKSKCLDYSI